MDNILWLAVIHLMLWGFSLILTPITDLIRRAGFKQMAHHMTHLHLLPLLALTSLFQTLWREIRNAMR